ncbi:hypothetical protein FW774_19475 [Pedobacter sp. BS3]|uniref:sialidase family protein n=1 Tax=Pedobacter sp. BS3 TaxID=2567937 RepID=UPI0011EDF1D6|nr:sialidase family protein [Pedobacter sp. BS3]TZF81116.1 hypothetical protein FW774_19475 [Pedobacter sp. BS3]
MKKIYLLLFTAANFVIFVACKTVSRDESGHPSGKETEQPVNTSGSAIVKTEFICNPPKTPELHASTIEETSYGLIAAWFGGTKEKNPDVGIWVSRNDHNTGWTVPVEVATGVTLKADGTTERYPCWNPVLFQAHNGGPLMLFYKVGPTTPEWWGMLITSTDGGKTWSKPQRLPDNIYGPIKNKPVSIGENGMLCPSSITSRLHFERTDDWGKTWTRTPSVTDRSIPVIQPSILFYGNGKLQAVGRTLKDKRVFSIWSADNGSTWSNFHLLKLPNPNSGTDAVTLKDGRQLLVYNHSEDFRSPLNVALSDDGENWYQVLVIENDKDGGYSYPAVIQTKDGLVHITYSWRRKNIKHVVIDPAKLTGKPILAWNFEAAGITGAETSSTSTFTVSGLEKAVLSRGAGITAQKASNSFAAAFPVNADLAAAEAGRAYYQLTVKAKNGYKVSLSSIGITLRVQTDAPKTYLWKYSVDGGYNFTPIGEPYTVTSGFTDNNGLQQPQLELAQVKGLQQVDSSGKIILRLYAWGGNSVTANNGFRIGKSNAVTDALVINGTVIK